MYPCSSRSCKTAGGQNWKFVKTLYPGCCASIYLFTGVRFQSHSTAHRWLRILHSRFWGEKLACHQLEPKTRPKRKWYIIKPFPHFGKSGNGFMLYHFRFLKKRKYYFRILEKTEMVLCYTISVFRKNGNTISAF